MPPLKLQKDTQKVLERQKRTRDFVASDDWKFIKKKCLEKVVAQSSLSRIRIAPNTNNEAMARELTARGLAAQIVVEWIADIEGDAKQYEENIKLLQQTEEEEIIKIFPGERSEFSQ